MATSTLQTNAANDLYLPDGKNLIVISGKVACAQNVLHATLMRLTEDIYDVSSGVDYFGAIFVANPDSNQVRSTLSKAILGVQDVISIESLTISLSGNNLTYLANINTIYGQITVSNQS